MKKHLISVTSEIVLDNYDEGLTDCTGCGLNEKIGITFDTEQDLLNHLHWDSCMPESTQSGNYKIGRSVKQRSYF